MLNEKKIRLMARTAIYEKHQGKEDMKINQYCGGDYVRFNMFKTIIGVTISVLLCSAVYIMYQSDDIFEVFFRIDLPQLGRLVLSAYILAVIVYVIISLLFYQYKWMRAQKRLKRFNKNLDLILKYTQRDQKQQSS